MSVIASLGENCVLKAQTDSLQKTKSREEGGVAQILTSSGRTYIVALGSACKSPLESSVLLNERISLPGSQGCCKDEITDVKCFEGEDFL